MTEYRAVRSHGDLIRVENYVFLREVFGRHWESLRLRRHLTGIWRSDLRNCNPSQLKAVFLSIWSDLDLDPDPDPASDPDPDPDPEPDPDPHPDPDPDPDPDPEPDPKISKQ